MGHSNLDKVLSCRSLPSLPSVAVEVLELTRDPDIGIDELALVVQRDPGLAARVLRTINSSYYRLSHPCASIDRAMTFLGVNAVKSLVLGFSLLEISKGVDERFDMRSHWRRAIYAASAARHVAEVTAAADPDDAFTAALFQDMGMVATYIALGEEYVRAISGLAHRGLAPVEQGEFGFDHAEAGAALASGWGLPEQVVVAIAHHHRPVDVRGGFGGLVRCGALGATMGEMLGDGADRQAMADLLMTTKNWFGTEADDLESMLARIAAGSSTLAEMFEQDIGQAPDVRQIMLAANERLVEQQLASDRRAIELQRQADTDALTGAANRKRFDEIARVAFAEAGRTGSALTLLLFDADRFKSINDTHGHGAGDAVLAELAARVTRVIGSLGTVCRYGGEEFAVVIPGKGAAAGKAIAEMVRASVAETPFDTSGVDGAPEELAVTISVGVAATDRCGVDSVEALVGVADAAVYAAKNGGRNRVCVGGDETEGGSEEGVDELHVMIVDDDALAAMLLQAVITKRGGLKTDVVASAGEVWSHLQGRVKAGGRLPHLIVSDQNMPGMSGIDLLEKLRSTEGTRQIPFILISASEDECASERAASLGAAATVLKRDLCRELNKWIHLISSTARSCETGKAAC